MKKRATRTKRSDEMRPEYDFSGGVRGKYAAAYAEGTNIVKLSPDVAAVFRDAEAVNDALRGLVRQKSNRFELLATWYLRFNGYFTTTGYTLHGNSRALPRLTDADVLGVRFPHSKEGSAEFPFERDPILLLDGDEIDFVICEVTSGRCKVNAPWRDTSRRAVEYAIRGMGFSSDENGVDDCARRVYEYGAGKSADGTSSVRFICVGEEVNGTLRNRLPGTLQITWSQVIQFLQRRFTLGCPGLTRDHWDIKIQEFANLCKITNDARALLVWAKQK